MASNLQLGKVNAIKAKLKVLKSKKARWLEMYQLIGDFVHNRKQNFTEVNEPGAFLTRDIFDNTAAKAADVASSAFLGALWPSGAQSFELLPAKDLADTKEHRDYFRKITEEAITIMDDARSGLAVALNEYMLDQMCFGTSGVAVFAEENGVLPIRYEAWDVKTMYIDEGKNRMIDTIYNETTKTVRQLMIEYGENNVSDVVKKYFNEGKEDELITVVHAIEPRLKFNKHGFGNKDKPIASIEFELKSGKILKESGYDSMPIFVSRLKKALGEVQGRAPAMAALPDIIELNVIWEVLTTASEKIAEPPLGILADGDLGTTTIDTSAGAINVFNISNRLGANKPIMEISTVGDLNPLILLVEKLTESISNHFLIDRLLDLNNETRMTLGEANIRNELRGQSLGSIFSRQKAELFNGMIERTVDILFAAGSLGVVFGSSQHAEIIAKGTEPIIIPDAVVKKILAGEEVFRIKYISPAERSIKAEEVQGNLTVLNVLASTATIDPNVVDVINLDEIIRRTAELTGSSKEIINGLDVIKEVRSMRQQQLAEQQQVETARQNSETMRNMAQAANTTNNQNGMINK